MFGKKIKVAPELYNKVKMYAEIAGYSSADEFVTHALEKEISQLEESEGEDQIREKLKGLGYLA